MIGYAQDTVNPERIKINPRFLDYSKVNETNYTMVLVLSGNDYYGMEKVTGKLGNLLHFTIKSDWTLSTIWGQVNFNRTLQ